MVIEVDIFEQRTMLLIFDVWLFYVDDEDHSTLVENFDFFYMIQNLLLHKI